MSTKRIQSSEYTENFLEEYKVLSRGWGTGGSRHSDLELRWVHRSSKTEDETLGNRRF